MVCALLALLPAASEAGARSEESLRELAAATREHLEAGEHAQAAESGRRWSEIAQQAGDAAELARARAATARALNELSQEWEAANLDELALEDIASAGLPEAELFDFYVRAALTLSNASRFAAAREALSRARELAERRDDPVLLTRVLAGEGSLETQRGDVVAALRARSKVVEVYEQLGDGANLAIALYHLGSSRIANHDYASGLRELGRAIELGLPERVERYARISLAIAHYELNQLDEAEAIFREVLEEAQRTGDLVNVAWASGELGLVSKQRGDNEAALEWCDRAIALSRRLRDVRNLVAWMSNKGVVLRNMGRHREALEVYRRTREAEAGTGVVFLGRTLAKLEGQSWSALGEDELAEPSLREASLLAREAGDFKQVWESELELGRLHRRRSEGEPALQAYLAALDAIEEVRGALRLESFKRDFFRDKVGVYAETIEFLKEHPELDEGDRRSFEIAERARARAFLDTLAESRADLEGTLPASVREREREILDAVSELQAQVRRGEVESPAGAQAESERLRGELEALELEVRERFPRFREMTSPSPTGLDEVRGELRPGEVLLAYFVAEPSSHLWAVEAEGVRHWRLPGAAEVEAQVRGVFAELVRPTSVPALDGLATALLGPWLSELGSPPESILVVPSGALHFVPFAALPIEGGRTLGDLAPTSYAPSATTWLELRRRVLPFQRPSLLALGDAVGRGGVDRLRAVADLGALETLGELPFSRAEVEGVASIFGRGSTTALLGEEATETRLVSSAPGHTVLHLATHGWIDPSTPSASGLVLGAEPEGGDDGILQLREIVRLDLAADLVVLSACESALGELITGEGMVGLARSFFYAGAESVVATLWNVDDATSARFMEAFYRALRRGLSKAEALQTARAKIRADPATAHPYYWAPYVLLGRGDDGVRMPARGLPGWAIAACLLLGLGLAVGVTARRR